MLLVYVQASYFLPMCLCVEDLRNWLELLDTHQANLNDMPVDERIVQLRHTMIHAGQEATAIVADLRRSQEQLNRSREAFREAMSRPCQTNSCAVCGTRHVMAFVKCVYLC